MPRIVISLLFGFVLSACFSAKAQASTINAASCSSSDVQAAINSAAGGDVIAVPSGTCTWTTQVSVPAEKLSLIGQSTCTNAGASKGACTDNTVITLADTSAEAFAATNATASNFVDVSGFTFKLGSSSFSQGEMVFAGPSWPPTVAFRFHGNHLIVSSAGGPVFLLISQAYGLVDSNVWDVQNASGNPALMDIFADWGTAGFKSWQLLQAFGNNQAVIIETNTFNFADRDTEGVYDGYAGARVVLRYNYILNDTDWGGHGTDSGGYRSVMSYEDYKNTYVNDSSYAQPIFYMRGGTALVWGNTYSGATGWQAGALNYYRVDQITDAVGWGIADGTKWLLRSTDPSTDAGRINTTAGPDWTASHSYANIAAILPLSHNAGAYNYSAQGACTSASTYPTFNQTIGSSTTDGTCTWKNEGGGAAGVGAHWCAINRDTPATADSTCSAITPGDTATTFFDGNGPGGYPARDEPGRTHNQALAPVYEWDNGTNDPGMSADGTLVKANRDYYNYTSTFDGTSGVGSGLLSARPSTCTPYVAYWASDTDTLYQCSAANTWTLYYQPYTYPDPLTAGSQSGSAPTPPANLQVTAVH